MRLKNKVAFITGAASGIGQSIAEQYAKEGANVIIADLNIAAAKEVAKSLDTTHGQKHLAVEVDVTSEAQVNQGVADAISQLGAIDILISNAGIQRIAPVHELSLDHWRQMLAIHLDGAFLTTKACLNHMYKAGNGGKIIYVGSVHSKVASKLKSPYVTAKHGLVGLNKVVAKEAAEHKVSSHLVCPGFVKTPLVEKQIPEQAASLGITEEEVIKNVMLKDTVDQKFTTLEELAEMCIFLGAYKGLALTGQSFIVSHGWEME